MLFRSEVDSQAPGTYTQSLTVDFSVRLIGAGPGSTTISATHGVPGSTVYISHLYGTDVVISGVTVTGGNAQVQGGGIFNDTGYLGRSSLVLIDSVVAKNVAGAEGGGTTGPTSPSGASSKSTITGA